MKRLVALVSLVALAALVVAGCGGGAGPTATAPAAPPATPTATAVPAATPVPTPTPVPATPTPAAAAPKYGGTLTSRVANIWASWDSYDTRGSFSGQNMLDALDYLVEEDRATAKIEGDLAERWELAADGSTVTFFIRKGVKWHDGKDLTASDIAWNLNRAINGTGTVTWNKGRFVNVNSIETPDQFTVRVNMKRPSASFLPNMATPFMLMYAPHGLSPEKSEEYKSNVIGTGPFKLERYKGADIGSDWVRNEGFWKKDAAGRRLPYVDKSSLVVITDATLALSAFRAGRIDCGCESDSDYMTPQYSILKREMPGAKLLIGQQGSLHMVFNQKKPWTDPLVRRAVQVGLDRLAVRDLWRDGTGFYPPFTFRPPEAGGKWGLTVEELLKIPGFRVKDGKKDPADLAEGQRLFKEAGVDPATISVTFSSSSFFGELNDILQDVLARTTGMKVQVASETTTIRNQRLASGGFDIALYASSPTIDDPTEIYPNVFLSDGIQNYGKWQRPEVDALFARLDPELDAAKRRELVWQLQRKLLDDGGFSPLTTQVVVGGTQAYVFGYIIKRSSGHAAYMHKELLWIDRG